MKIRSLAVAALALALPFSAVACSDDDSSGDLSEAEIKKQLKEEAGFSEEMADCAAGPIKELDISEEELKKFSPTDPSGKGKQFADIITKCMTESMPEVSIPEMPDGAEGAGATAEPTGN